MLGDESLHAPMAACPSSYCRHESAENTAKSVDSQEVMESEKKERAGGTG